MNTKNRWLVLGILTSTLFLIVMDMTILYTALPRLTSALSASASEKLWIVNAYPLVVAGLLPGMGMLSDRMGHKRLFLSGLPVFALASLLAAFSFSSGLLITSRALLAIGAAMMMPATLAIVRQIFSDRAERALAIGIWSAVASGGAALGPVTGGILLEYFWWGSVFLINVPVVLCVFVMGMLFIPSRAGNPKRPCDVISSVQIMVGLVGIIYALKELSKQDLSLVSTLTATVTGVVFLSLFIRRQKRQQQPMIDFSLFRNRLFSCGVIIAVCSMIVLLGIELVLTQRLQLVMGLSPLMAALFILPIPVASAISGPIAGIALPRYGEANIIVFGFLVAAAGAAGLAMFYDAGLPIQLICLFILGFGLGSSITAASMAIMINAPDEKAGMVAAIEDVSWELGGVLGVTLLGGLMTAAYSRGIDFPEGLEEKSITDSLDEAIRFALIQKPEQAEMIMTMARAAFDNAYIYVLLCATALLITSMIAVYWVFIRRSARAEGSC